MRNRIKNNKNHWSSLQLRVAAISDWLILWRGLLICKINEKATQLDQAGQHQLIIPIPVGLSTTFLRFLASFK
jgi:hypothetical protein